MAKLKSTDSLHHYYHSYCCEKYEHPDVTIYCTDYSAAWELKWLGVEACPHAADSKYHQADHGETIVCDHIYDQTYRSVRDLHAGYISEP